MGRILLGVSFLSGWLVLSTCLRQYHFVDELATWDEARSYCRAHHTDLATIGSTEEMTQLVNSITSSGNTYVWIGLFSRITWWWSDGYRETEAGYRNWDVAHMEPNFFAGAEFCVSIGDDGQWWDENCSMVYPFICYNGTQLDPQFVAVNEKMTWSSARRYCREHYIDLATVRGHTENRDIFSVVPRGDRAWIGLFRDPLFYWSDGSGYSFSLWDSSPHLINSLTVCGVAFQISGTWTLMSCDMRQPFVCYNIITPVKKQVVKLKIKLGDRSVDLNDPAVKAGILKKLQDRIQTEAGSGVNLKWREQSDGKVFHKEGKSPQEKQRKKTEL